MPFKFHRADAAWPRHASYANLMTSLGPAVSVRVPPVGAWLSLVEHLVRDQGVGGSNPLAPTIPLSPPPHGAGYQSGLGCCFASVGADETLMSKTRSPRRKPKFREDCDLACGLRSSTWPSERASSLRLEADAAQQILEARVGAQRVPMGARSKRG